MHPALSSSMAILPIRLDLKLIDLLKIYGIGHGNVWQDVLLVGSFMEMIRYLLILLRQFCIFRTVLQNAQGNYFNRSKKCSKLSKRTVDRKCSEGLLKCSVDED